MNDTSCQSIIDKAEKWDKAVKTIPLLEHIDNIPLFLKLIEANLNRGDDGWRELRQYSTTLKRTTPGNFMLVEHVYRDLDEIIEKYDTSHTTIKGDEE